MFAQLRGKMSFANVVSLVALFVALGGTSYAALSKNSVGSKQIKTDAVKADEIASSAVGSDEIVDGSVGTADLAPDSVNGSKVANGSLTAEDLAQGVLDPPPLGPDSVTGGNVVDGSLTGDDVADGGIGLADIADNSVDSKRVVTDSLNGRDIENGSLTPSDIAPGAFLGGTVTVQYEVEPSATGLADGTKKSYDASCPADQIAIGGGSRGDATDSEYTVTTSSRPLRTGGGFPTDGQSFNGWRVTVLNPSGNSPFTVPPPDGALQPEVWAICAG